jgi:hypothetical protein
MKHSISEMTQVRQGNAGMNILGHWTQLQSWPLAAKKKKPKQANQYQ